MRYEFDGHRGDQTIMGDLITEPTKPQVKWLRDASTKAERKTSVFLSDMTSSVQYYSTPEVSICNNFIRSVHFCNQWEWEGKQRVGLSFGSAQFDALNPLGLRNALAGAGVCEWRWRTNAFCAGKH